MHHLCSNNKLICFSLSHFQFCSSINGLANDIALQTIIMYLKTLLIKFKNDLPSPDIPLFRGAIIRAMGASLESGNLFHNHVYDGFNYIYPLIQYKRVQCKAAILCIAEGCDEVLPLLSDDSLYLKLYDRNGIKKSELFIVDKIIPQMTKIQVVCDSYDYFLNRWLPLNNENYEKYSHLDGLVDRMMMLENLLVSNILTSCRGMGVEVDNPIKCQILQINESQNVRYKDLSWKSFSCKFRSNIVLPSYIGIGKGSSVGFGIITPSTNIENKRIDYL